MIINECLEIKIKTERLVVIIMINDWRKLL